MERYLGENCSGYSKGTMRLLIPLSWMIMLSILSVLGGAFSDILKGKNLSGETAPLNGGEILLLLLVAGAAVGFFIMILKLYEEKRCGDASPRLSLFLAKSTRETVPVDIVSQVLKIKPGKTVPFLKDMLRLKYIRNLEISPDGGHIRILKFHRIEVFEVYCSNCGAQYTQTSEDDLICQYCDHPVRKVLSS